MSQVDLSSASSRFSRADLPTPLKGVVPPLVTPLAESGAVDIPAFERLIERTIQGGVHGLFLLGTTGEFCSLDLADRRLVIQEGCAAARQALPVLINISETSLSEAVRLSQVSAKAGAKGVVFCPPYYYAITQADLERYARRLADSVELPVFLYNIPQYAGVEFAPETVSRLADHPNIVGLKNSNGRLDYLIELMGIKQQRPNFSLLVGTEETTLEALRLGADGSICGGANMFPSLYVDLYEAFVNGQQESAENLQRLVLRVSEAVYSIGPKETSYLRGLKCAMAHLGICHNVLAEPFTAFTTEEKHELESRLSTVLPEFLERN